MACFVLQFGGVGQSLVLLAQGVPFARLRVQFVDFVDLPGQPLALQRIGGGVLLGVQPRLAGVLPSPAPCVVEASPDLAQWTPIFTNTSASVIEFVDTQSTNHPRRFYRLATPSTFLE